MKIKFLTLLGFILLLYPTFGQQNYLPYPGPQELDNSYTDNYPAVELDAKGNDILKKSISFNLHEAGLPQNLQNSKSNQSSTVTDIDGNIYSIVQIGDRWWMAENLKVSRYRNSDPIIEGAGIQSLEGMIDPKFYFYYNHNPSMNSVYGKLYTWGVIDDPRKICPEGWYIPTEEDLLNLKSAADPGGNNIAGGNMKTTGTIEAGTGLWNGPNVGATNSSGFSALPSGWFSSGFNTLGDFGTFSCSTPVSQTLSLFGNVRNENAQFVFLSNNNKTAAAVRCVKSTSESISSPTIFTLPAEEITFNSAKIGGSVMNDGGESVSDRGLFWGTSPNPSGDNRTFNRSGKGTYFTTLEKLRPSTTYYYRAYAKNNAGISLGEENSFTTPSISAAPALSIASQSFLKYWEVLKNYNIGMTADVMADHSTISWGNFGWRDNSVEPRIPWNNSPEYTDAAMTYNLWQSMYELVLSVNDVLFALNEQNLQIGIDGIDNPKVLATMYFIRGVVHGQLGLTFDKAWIYRDSGNPLLLPLQPWQEVIAAAIQDLQAAIAICNNHTFSWGNSLVNGMNIDNNYLSQLSNSYAARFLVLGARTKEQNDNMSWINYSWNDVINFTQNGIVNDFAPIGNGLPWEGGTWWDLHIKYLRHAGWGRVDNRIINLLDRNYPVRYPTNQDGFGAGPPVVYDFAPPGTAFSPDSRLISDFQYLQNVDFRPERGVWHFSHYRHSRYDYPATTNSEGLFMGESRGPLRELRTYDNLLMRAEAYARTGILSGAASIINEPSLERIKRGGLPEVMPVRENILDAIFYERDIELFHNGYLISFCDMRRRDLLQYGTPLHFPVPGKILKDMGLGNYTYGGFNNADGINTSNGGDWITPSYHFQMNNVIFKVRNNGLPVKDAKILLANYVAEHQTNDDGQLEIKLLNGNFSFAVMANDCEPYTGSISLLGGGKEILVELMPLRIQQLINPDFCPEVYPNPFKDNVNIENAENVKRIVITNILTQHKLMINCNGDKSYTIPTANIPAGFYIIELYSEAGERQVRKMMKL